MITILSTLTTISILSLTFSCVLQKQQKKETKEKIRIPQYSGSWYPETKQKILEEIKNFKLPIQPEEKNLKALILPHAGWVYSGKLAYHGISKIPHKYKKIILIGPSHRALFQGASLPKYNTYETPLGKLKISNTKEELLKNSVFQITDADTQEHSLEILLPLLQTQLPEFKILPIVISSANSYKQIKDIAAKINKIIDDETFIIISSDFTHYGPAFEYTPFKKEIEQNIKDLDMQAIKLILDLKPIDFLDFCKKTQITICGRYPIAILLETLQHKHYDTKLIAYTTSGKLTNDFQNSVSYATIGFYQTNHHHHKQTKTETKEKKDEEQYTALEQTFLLKLARDTLTNYLKNKTLLKPEEDKIPKKLLENRACFTTLNKNHELRGCVGNLTAQNKLYRSVQENIIHAAINDTRFNPVTLDELKSLKIEISILTPPKDLTYNTPEELLTQLKPHIHGVTIENNNRASTYLPQVWEYFTDKQDFLSSLCEKGGMPADSWKHNTTKIQTYKAIILSE